MQQQSSDMEISDADDSPSDKEANKESIGQSETPLKKAIKETRVDNTSPAKTTNENVLTDSQEQDLYKQHVWNLITSSL